MNDLEEQESIAEAVIVLSIEAFAAAMEGDVLAAARIAGIMAAKKTSELIPLRYPPPLNNVTIDFETQPDRSSIRLTAATKTAAQTGAEMEALTAVSIAALTIYDMVKAVGKGAAIEGIRLVSKSDAKSGEFVAPQRKAFAPTAKTSSRAKPSVIAHEATSPPKVDSNAEREAFRNFMVARQLRATEWAKQAGVPASQIYSFLTGRSRGLTPEIAEKLARAARARVEDMFSRAR